MYEDLYQVYRYIGGDCNGLLASAMTIDNATLFAKAWMQENCHDDELSVEIKKQPTKNDSREFFGF